MLFACMLILSPSIVIDDFPFVNVIFCFAVIVMESVPSMSIMLPVVLSVIVIPFPSSNDMVWPLLLKVIFGPRSVPAKFDGFPKAMAVRPTQIHASAEESALMIPNARAARGYKRRNRDTSRAPPANSGSPGGSRRCRVLR